MLCTRCKTIWPYAKAKACLTCGSPCRLTADDLLGPTAVQIVKETRPSQVEFAKAVEKGIINSRHVTAEAGTGTGKSFAALLPPILAGKRIVVSSATIALQSQYMDKDLPFLQDALKPHGVSFDFALAKGRSNYLCPLQYNLLTKPGKDGKKKLDVPAWLDKWVQETHTGDRSEHRFPCPPEIWVRIDAQDCLGEDYCPMRNDCQFLHVRSLMKKANVIVANHAIVGFDIRFGLNRLLPPYDLLLLDEAHKAQEYFGNAFTETLTEKRLGHLISDIDESGVLTGKVADEWGADKGEAHIARDSLLDLGQLNEKLFKKFTRGTQSKVAIDALQVDEMNEMCHRAEKITYYLASLARMINNVVPQDFAERKRYFFGAAKDRQADERAFRFIGKLERLTSTLAYIGTDDPNQRSLRYIEYPVKSTGGKVIAKRPIDIGPILKDKLFPNRQVIASSATITVSNSFTRFQQDMGFDPAQTDTYIAVSPFDFDRRALLYLSKVVRVHPDKDKTLQPGGYDAALEEYYETMADEMYALCNRSNGHAFALFTSGNEMDIVAQKFMLKMKPDEFTIIVQGNVSPAEAERQFRSGKNPVLFGLKSFWEGISIEGDQLRLVMIAKVPFPPRDDLLHQEVKKQFEEKYGSGYRAFLELDVSKMVMETKQAAGRLLRTMKDYGVVAILDRKITNEWKSTKRTYAKILVNDLPFTQVTYDLNFVSKFLQQFQVADKGKAKEQK